MTDKKPNAEAPSSITEEVKLIPPWSIAVAALVFVFMQYLSWVFCPLTASPTMFVRSPRPLASAFTSRSPGAPWRRYMCSWLVT